MPLCLPTSWGIFLRDLADLMNLFVLWGMNIERQSGPTEWAIGSGLIIQTT